MDKFECKTITTSRSLTYTYYRLESSNNDNSSKSKYNLPTLLLLHGFPDSAHLWEDIVAHLPTGSDTPALFSSILIPDLLGYGGSAKPTEALQYNFHAQADDLVDMLDAEDVVDGVVAMGHDFGSTLAQRLYLFHPSRVAGLILLNVAYMPPSPEPMPELDVLNDYLEKTVGYPSLAYWELFTAEDAAELLERRLDRFYEVLHGDEQGWMKKMFCVRGGMRAYLETSENEQKVDLKPYARVKGRKEKFIQRMKRDGFEAPLAWYHAMRYGVQYEAEKDVPKDRMKINIPVLFIGCVDDVVSQVNMIEGPKAAGFLPDLDVQVIQAGHWSPWERPEEISKMVVEFLQKKQKSKQP